MEEDNMQLPHPNFAIRTKRTIGVRRASYGIRALTLVCAVGFISIVKPGTTFAAPYVEFDIAPTAECRDITPPERIAQIPNQRLIEVTLPVSVRFQGVSMDDVEELAIEVNGASAGMRISDFAPATQLASEITHEIETTTTTKKTRSFDGSLGGTLPVPGADAVAHITPSISAGLSDCDTASEKVNRLPPKHAVVVSGTSLAGRGVFFKLKRYSQTSLEGVHELKVTFVAPRAWRWAEIEVNCAARGERKMLWMKQPATIGQSRRMVQLVAMAAKPVRQVVLKPTEGDPAVAKTVAASDAKPPATSAPQWKPSRDNAAVTQPAAATSGESKSKDKKSAGATWIAKEKE
jgi:hypothetical protein